MISEPGTAIFLPSSSSMGVSNELVCLIKNKKCLQRIPGFIFLSLLVNNKKIYIPTSPLFEGVEGYFKL